uniref:EEF1A lysine methyltransferase 4 n=1 Tax=Ciona savignyi TaxID=51511 RepID=H2Z6S3_CIOSA
MANHNKLYKEKEYWDHRYENEDSYDWFKSYDDFKNVLKDHMDKNDKILILGCGNSPFSLDLYKDGYKNVTNVDYSTVCIENMKQKYQNLSEMSWYVMDITNLQFEASTFDVVIDKGTLDALLVEENDVWNISETAFETMEAVLRNVSTVLKVGGRFVSITFSQPHFRKKILARSKFNWDVQTFSIGDSGCFEYFLYVMTKGKELSKEDKQFELKSKQSRSE